MTIKHFIVVYDIQNAVAHVTPYGDQYDAALEAYAKEEAHFRDDPDVEVVLLGSDSEETLRQTHSSYFELADEHIDRVVAKALQEYGLQ